MSFDKAPRKKSLIKHPPSRSMSERGEVRLLTKQLRKLENTEPTPENIKLMLRLSQRIGRLRDGVKRRKNPPVIGRPVGRPKKEKPAVPEVVNPLTAVLEAERLERQRVATETPEPSIVFEHARRAEVKAKIKKEREAVENLPITATQSDVQEVVNAITPPEQTPEMETITRAAEKSAKRQSSTRADVDFFERVMKPLESRDVVAPVRQEYEGCDFDPIRQEITPPSEPVDGGGYLAEWDWVPPKW